MKYVGNELTLFSQAANWKSYWGDKIKSYLGQYVLEVGAGIGANTQFLIQNDGIKKWVCLEPDPELAQEIEHRVKFKGNRNTDLNIYCSYLKDYSLNYKFDSILYIDVIEHIEDDFNELDLAVNYLNPGGYLIILVPAYNFLFNEFDTAIGHYRRYDKVMLESRVPKEMQKEKLFYLDSLGLAASFVNTLFLHQSSPSEKQIEFWDKKLVPLSKITDSLIFNTAGKSLLGVWKKPK